MHLIFLSHTTWSLIWICLYTERVSIWRATYTCFVLRLFLLPLRLRGVRFHSVPPFNSQNLPISFRKNKISLYFSIYIHTHNQAHYIFIHDLIWDRAELNKPCLWDSNSEAPLTSIQLTSEKADLRSPLKTWGPKSFAKRTSTTSAKTSISSSPILSPAEVSLSFHLLLFPFNFNQNLSDYLLFVCFLLFMVFMFWYMWYVMVLGFFLFAIQVVFVLFFWFVTLWITEYNDENFTIPSGSSVIIKRVPAGTVTPAP